ncbi:MAG TPA: nitrogenase stabilizing/protective protein NifW [Rhodocyclaceae bacterium]|nr:nitrogenase stabilizing/protective protein NifW [Rhodocyclaceae bacterium]
MNPFIERLSKLSSAEEFLEFFGIPYDQAVVHVNRLHILKRFYQYLRKDQHLGKLDEAAMYQAYRSLLLRSYQDFVTSTPAREKVFKVFQDAEGKSFAVDSLRQTLPSRG